MDLRKHAVAETGILFLRGADGEFLVENGKQAIIEVYSPGSKQFAKATTVRTNNSMERIKKKGKVNLTEDQIDSEHAEFLATCTKRFENIEYAGPDGQPLEGEALFTAVYMDPYLGFIGEQVQEFLKDWGNFTKSAPKP